MLSIETSLIGSEELCDQEIIVTDPQTFETAYVSRLMDQENRDHSMNKLHERKKLISQTAGETSYGKKMRAYTNELLHKYENVESVLQLPSNLML